MVLTLDEEAETFWDKFHTDDNFKLELLLEENYNKWELNLLLKYPNIDLRRLIENSVFLDNSELSRVIAKTIAGMIENLRHTKGDIATLMDNPIYPNMISQKGLVN